MGPETQARYSPLQPLPCSPSPPSFSPPPHLPLPRTARPQRCTKLASEVKVIATICGARGSSVGALGTLRWEICRRGRFEPKWLRSNMRALPP